jgi:hypothetical protein
LEGGRRNRFFFPQTVSRVNSLDGYIQRRFSKLFTPSARTSKRLEFDARHPLAVMQDFVDSRLEEVKILSNFEIERESSFYEMSVYDFYFHVWVKSNNTDKE